MTKDVLVSIEGIQFEVDKEEPVEVITVGEYYYKNDKHFILFEEILEDSQGVTKNTVKVSGNQVTITKKGANNVNMVFEENQKNMSYYHTPYGELLIGINTTKVQIEEQEDTITVRIDYGLDLNYNHISDCSIVIKITSKETLKRI